MVFCSGGMDRIIKRFDSELYGDLVLTGRGIVYQNEMHHINYGDDYFEKCRNYDDGIEKAVIAGRINFIKDHFDGCVLDIGIGSGKFVESREKTWGYDINPAAVTWLREKGLYSEELSNYEAYTFWDVIEHVDEPEKYFKRIPKNALVFASLPIFPNTGPESFIKNIRESKHYRPDEHLYYFTEKGFIDWMACYGFRLLETSGYERDAGRESITAFAFKKDLPDYNDFIGMYKHIHENRHYGASAHVYLKYFTEIIRWLNPATILDYGCGRSDLVSYFYLDGERDLARYDPAIPEYKKMPVGDFDLVICCDVMEHISIKDVDRVFAEIREKSQRVLFVISTKLAKANLPNGMNAHVTLLKKSEWIRWVEDYFGKVSVIKTEWPHALMLRSF